MLLQLAFLTRSTLIESPSQLSLYNSGERGSINFTCRLYLIYIKKYHKLKHLLGNVWKSKKSEISKFRAYSLQKYFEATISTCMMKEFHQMWISKWQTECSNAVCPSHSMKTAFLSEVPFFCVWYLTYELGNVNLCFIFFLGWKKICQRVWTGTSQEKRSLK